MTTLKDLLPKDFKAQFKKAAKEALEHNNTASHSPSSSNAPSNQIAPTDDSSLFKQAMHGVRPLKQEKSVVQKVVKSDPNSALRRLAAQGDEPNQSHALSDMQALLNPVAGEAFLSYKAPTLQNKVFEQLRQGKLRWYDAVDLHGADIDDARAAVSTLINNARASGETVVKIVHGKGADAVIKTCVNGWLRQIPDVLAFVSAPAGDGGNGAVLVLLKRRSLT